MITYSDLKELTKLRLKEAEALIRVRQYSGAYYLSGYAIECALKACIAKKTKRYEFPDKDVVFKSYSHRPDELVGVAGLRAQLNAKLRADATFAINWSTVTQWTESSRYEKHKSKEATDLILAITDPNHGVLIWIQQYW